MGVCRRARCRTRSAEGAEAAVALPRHTRHGGAICGATYRGRSDAWRLTAVFCMRGSSRASTTDPRGVARRESGDQARGGPRGVTGGVERAWPGVTPRPQGARTGKPLLLAASRPSAASARTGAGGLRALADSDDEETVEAVEEAMLERAVGRRGPGRRRGRELVPTRTRTEEAAEDAQEYSAATPSARATHRQPRSHTAVAFPARPPRPAARCSSPARPTSASRPRGHSPRAALRRARGHSAQSSGADPDTSALPSAPHP